MTDQAQAVETATEEVINVTKPQDIVREGYTLKYSEITIADFKGFGFYYPEFKTLDGATSHYGAEALLGRLVNPKLQAQLGTKARNKMNKQEGEKDEEYKNRLQTLLEEGENIIVSPQEAEEWKPGERDVTSISGVTKKMMEAIKAAKEAKQAGDNDRFVKCSAEAKEFRALLSELQDAEMNKLEEAA
jgi:hypothetical protein